MDYINNDMFCPYCYDGFGDISAMHSPNIKSAMYVLDFLVTWPMRYAVNIGLLILLLAITFTMIPRLGRTGRTTPSTRPSAAINIIALSQHVAEAHLFGQEPPQASGGNAGTAAAEVKVQGLLYSDDQMAALAILEVDGKSGSFRIGDMLADGEKLTAIAPAAVQLTQGMVQRVVEMPQQFGGSGDGVVLTGDTGLPTFGPQFPALVLHSGAGTYKPALRTVAVSQGENPLDQLRSLRQQLIAPHPAAAPSAATKQTTKP